MPSITQGYFDSSRQRVVEFDSRRRNAGSLNGRTMPSLDTMAIGESRNFDLFLLFADIRRSTRVISKLMLSQSARLLVNFLIESTRVIRDFGGQVEKYSGDRVLGLFGSEGGDAGDLARQTIHCALAIRCITRKVLNPFYENAGLPTVKVGIGIDYGPVLVEKVGIRGDNELSVIGISVNVASKLEEMARDDQILMGNDVSRKLSIDYQKMCVAESGDERWTYTQDGKPYPFQSFTGDFDLCRQ